MGLFDWLFGAECPLELDERAWFDAAWLWLQEEFGAELPLQVTPIEPTPAFFPDAYDGSEAAARALFTRVQGYMQLAEQPLKLRFYAERDPDQRGALSGRVEHHEGSAGTFQQAYGGATPTISLEVNQLRDPMALVATVAHELGHVHLIGHGRLTGEEEHHEPLTDLLTVYFGLGVFNANATIRESNWQDLEFSGWSVGRSGYLTQEQFGYALALFAHRRGEAKPAWAEHLCTDVAAYFRRSLKQLARDGWSPPRPGL